LGAAVINPHQFPGDGLLRLKPRSISPLPFIDTHLCGRIYPASPGIFRSEGWSISVAGSGNTAATLCNIFISGSFHDFQISFVSL
jgi:hypothetical protein